MTLPEAFSAYTVAVVVASNVFVTDPVKLSVFPLIVMVDFVAFSAVNLTSILSVNVVPLSLSAETDTFLSAL